MTWRISRWVIHDMGLVFYDMSDSMPQCVSYGKLALGLFQTSPDCQYVWYVDFVFKVFLDRNLDNFTFWGLASLSVASLTLTRHCAALCRKRHNADWCSLFLSCGAHPLKHGHLRGQKLPASTGPLWRCITVDGDPESIWPGAEPGEKLGAAFPRACLFFYLFCSLLLPAFPRPGLRHGPPAQSVQWQRRAPQRQPPALQTQTLPHFASAISPQLQQVWGPLLHPFFKATNPIWLDSFERIVLCSMNRKHDSWFKLLLSFYSGAAPHPNLPHLLQLLRLPHPPCVPRLPPQVCRCPTSGAQDPQGPSDPHPEPVPGPCSPPRLACLPLHLFYKVLPTQLQQVQFAETLLLTAFTVCWSVSAVHGNTLTNMWLKKTKARLPLVAVWV